MKRGHRAQASSPTDDHGRDDRKPPVKENALCGAVLVGHVEPDWNQNNQDRQDYGRRGDCVTSIGLCNAR